MSKGKFLWCLSATVLAIIIAAPMLLIAAAIFYDDPTDAWEHIYEYKLQTYLTNSCLLLIGVVAVSNIIGISCAWLTTAFDFSGVRFFRWALAVPLAIPSYVMAYCWTDTFSFSGPIQSTLREFKIIDRMPAWVPSDRSLFSAILVLSFALYPYIYLIMRGSFRNQGLRSMEAARSLGHGPYRGFFTAVLASLKPAIAAGTALVGFECLAEWGAVDHLGLDVLTTGIYRTWQGFYSYEAAMRLSGFLLFFIAILLLFEFLLKRRHDLNTLNTSEHHKIQKLHGWKNIAASGFCILIFFFACLLPIIRLIYLAALTNNFSDVFERYTNATNTSLILAAISVVVILTIAIFYGLLARLAPHPLSHFSIFIMRIGYAIPGSVLAIAIITPFAWIDNSLISPFFKWFNDSNIRLALTGSIFILIFAYLTRFFAVALAPIKEATQRPSPRIEESATSLGRSRFSLIFTLYPGLMRPGILTAALLIAVEVIKELPATIILRPFNYDTLAVRIHQEVAQESLEGAALPSLLIIGLCCIPMILLTRYKQPSEHI